jgi:type VI secretion system protein ImpE
VPVENKFVADLSLAEKLKAAQDAVRKHPDAAAARVYLFQLQAVLGLWDKALIQLQAAAQFDPAAIPMAQMYREAMRAEAFRSDVFAGKRTPNVLGTPPDWIGSLIESLKLLGANEFEAAAELRTNALESAETYPGTLDDVAFDWIADADARIGPVFEIIMNGQYYWAPQQDIASIKFDAPVDLRDLVWSVCTLRFRNGGEQTALMPVRYPVTASLSDPLLLSKLTEWEDVGAETWCGRGQRMFATSSVDAAMLDVRHIEFHQ